MPHVHFRPALPKVQSYAVHNRAIAGACRGFSSGWSKLHFGARPAPSKTPQATETTLRSKINGSLDLDDELQRLFASAGASPAQGLRRPSQRAPLSDGPTQPNRPDRTPTSRSMMDGRRSLGAACRPRLRRTIGLMPKASYLLSWLSPSQFQLQRRYTGPLCRPVCAGLFRISGCIAICFAMEAVRHKEFTER